MNEQLKQFRDSLDEVLADMIWDDARPAAEAVAESIGLHWERRGERVEVYVQGQRPRSGWARALTLGFKGLWASGSVALVEKGYEPGGYIPVMRRVYK